MDLHVITRTGADAALNEAAVRDFRASLRGELLCPGDEGYDAARRLWNGMVLKTPALIARCGGVADVMTTLSFAREHDIVLAIRGGGHNVAGQAMCDHGVVMDLSRMKGIRVNPSARTARAEAGLLWGEFDCETQAFGLATTGGVVSTTGIAGLTLGGGIGWLCRRHGLSCDNLLSADIVTADGQFLRASASENADLYWGVRGAGANLGVVTSFVYQLHAVGRVLGGLVMYPIEQAKQVLRFYGQYTLAAPDELHADALLLTSPHGVPVVAIAVCYTGAMDAADQHVRPLRTLGTSLADLIQPMSYRVLQRMVDAPFPAGSRYYWKSNFVREIANDFVEVLVAHFPSVPSPRTAVIFQQMGGAAGRVSPDATAFRHRDARYNFFVASAWSDPADDEKNIRWSRGLWEATRPFSMDGVYVNELGEEGAERVRAAYGDNYERLATLKTRYDPTNFFGVNQNITPTK